ncbi:protein-disulfide isomerase [Marinomonas sp. CT5]|uniref:DsbA family protein n=1 Tax=Marinomonas sp. CT5 TaxID=2066133 RepID=UPI001BAFD061|nr:DsbA family protein [Marinomonas sp. CT5]QUX95209.1 protein-disulfide isomerase [Marinomonas sp. CT5]
MLNVHYFFDPMCGWCYGASSLVGVLADIPEFEIIYHPGGMIPKQAIDPSFRQHILQADAQIANMTKAHFGDAYKARVTGTEDYIVDSYSTTRAFLVGQEMGIEAHVMLAAIQKAHYQDGQHLDELNVLADLAVSMGLDKATWNEKMADSEAKMRSQVQESHDLMGQLQVSGYPTFILEKEDRLMRLPHSNYYGKTEEWKNYLAEWV